MINTSTAFTGVQTTIGAMIMAIDTCCKTVPTERRSIVIWALDRLRHASKDNIDGSLTSMSWHCGSIGVSDVPLMTSVYYENLTIAHSIAAASAAVTSVVALAVEEEWHSTMHTWLMYQQSPSPGTKKWRSRTITSTEIAQLHNCESYTNARIDS